MSDNTNSLIDSNLSVMLARKFLYERNFAGIPDLMACYDKYQSLEKEYKELYEESQLERHKVIYEHKGLVAKEINRCLVELNAMRSRQEREDRFENDDFQREVNTLNRRNA